MMRRLRLTARLHDPVAIKRSRQSQRSDIVRWISGSTVRGALAAHYLRSRGSAEDIEFQTLFSQEERCRFGPLDPGPCTIPLSASSCKRGPGFVADDGGHGVLDQLWLRVAERLGPRQLRVEELEPWMWCPRRRDDGTLCRAPLKNLTGFWDDAGQAKSAKGSESMVAAHVGIDRATATAAPSILFALEALEPADDPQCVQLVGMVELSDAAAEQALRGLLDGAPVYMGHAKTRGYGRVELKLADDALLDRDGAAKRQERAAWSRALAAFLRSEPFGTNDVQAERDIFFSIGFPTGAILVDRYLRCSLDPHDMLSWLPPLPAPHEPPRFHPADFGGEIAAATAVTRHDLVRGWNTAHALPKADDWAIARGSVYVYRFRGTDDQVEQLHCRLDGLEQSSVGLRRSEGFGTVQVSHPFHQHFCRPQQVTT